jgi:hypothetical protein
MIEIVPLKNVDKTGFLADYLQKRSQQEPELMNVYQKEIERIKQNLEK